MKKVMTVVISLVMLCCLAACSSPAKEPDVANVMKAIRENSSIELPDMAEMTPDRLDGYYDISSDKVESWAHVMAGSGATADEIIVGKFKTTDDATAFKSQMESRKAMLADLSAQYTPEEMTKINSCIMEVKDKYVFFAVCNDNEAAKKIFTDSF